MKRVREDVFRAWARATKERVLHLRESAEYNIIIKLNYFRNAQNHPKSIRTSARRSISRTTTRSRNVILKVASSNNHIWRLTAPVCLNTHFQHVLLKMAIEEVQGQTREERHNLNSNPGKKKL
jgi:hypothetical protein